MHLLFKFSSALLIASFGAGQAWIHGAASAADLSAMRSISRNCPTLAVEAGSGSASRYDAISMRDAYLRTRIADAASTFAGRPTDGCARTAR